MKSYPAGSAALPEAKCITGPSVKWLKMCPWATVDFGGLSRKLNHSSLPGPGKKIILSCPLIVHCSSFYLYAHWQKWTTFPSLTGEMVTARKAVSGHANIHLYKMYLHEKWDCGWDWCHLSHLSRATPSQAKSSESLSAAAAVWLFMSITIQTAAAWHKILKGVGESLWKEVYGVFFVVVGGDFFVLVFFLVFYTVISQYKIPHGISVSH